MSELLKKGEAAKKASKRLAQLSTVEKNQALTKIADHLITNTEYILEQNDKDLQQGKINELSDAVLDRLALSAKRIQDMAEGLSQVTQLPDPIGEKIESWTRPNGLLIEKIRVPLGVIGIIYEARPNVTVDAAALCLKTGNATLLRGSSSALHSNKAIVKCIQDALASAGIPLAAVQLLEDTSRETSDQMLRLNQYLDVLIPRGGEGLISHVVQHATVPVLETGVGNCHIFIDGSADSTMAIDIVVNAKTHRPAVCNAVETVLVHKEWAERHLASLVSTLQDNNVKLRVCETIQAQYPTFELASEQDWQTEYLDLTLSMKQVNNVEEAIAHIETYGTNHSECIVTEDELNAAYFLKSIDAAAVYHNASTRFTDGFEFGFGAEIGISTQKLHARGPMGLQSLTSYKYLMLGKGQIRE